MKTIPDKIMVKFGIFKISLFELILKRIDTFTFGCWSFLLVHIRITPYEDPKAL
jgi:hypothetical protein